MSGNIRLYNSSGYVELQAPASATSQILELPTDSIKPGLVHLHTETFSAVSSVSIDDVFGSDYTNYKIIIVKDNSTSGTSSLRLRSSGTDNTSSVYDNAFIFHSGSTMYSGDYQNDSRFGLNIASAPLTRTLVLDFINPNVVSSTRIMGLGSQTNGAAQYIFMMSGTHTDAVSFDGITLYVSAGTTTGSIRIYGYRNS